MLAAQYKTFNIMDHLTPLVRKEFPDSRTDKNFNWAKTKKTVIVNYNGESLLSQTERTNDQILF